MTASLRLGLAARSFVLAVVLGLALAFREGTAVQGALVLVVLAAGAVLVDRYAPVPVEWLLPVEGALAAVIVAGRLPDGGSLLPYLVVPAMLAGIGGVTPRRTAATVVVVVGTEAAGLLAILMPEGAAAPVGENLELATPWLLAGVGAGLTAGWVDRLRASSTRSDDASYESARRLLSQLRIVARRLSSGLDPVSMAGQMLSSTHESLDDVRSGVFVRTEGAVLAPLSYRGADAQHVLNADGPGVNECWAQLEPVVEPVTRAGTAHHRVVLPLRTGSRMLGVVLAETAEPPRPEVVTALMTELDEQAVRLDTALVFDEVRSLATMEERQRLAREIHDGVAQEVASLGYLVDDLSAGEESADQRARLAELRREISRVVSELRLSIFDLRSEISPAAGLGAALSDYVRTVGSRSGLTVHLRLDEGPTRLRNEVETELLRIAQEAVTNARKHAGAENLWVDCQVHPPYARITVTDDGVGLGDGRPDSYGLKIMRERADRIGATLDIATRDDQGVSGTKVAVTVGDERSRG